MQSNDIFGVMALGIGFFFFYLIFVGGIITLTILYFKNLIELMTLVRPTNRVVGVGHIMLMFIPFFNLVYGFLLHPRISDSIKNEYATLGLASDDDFGRGLGIVFQSLTVACLIPLLNILAAVGLLVVFILYWIKMNGYRKELLKFNENGFSNDLGISNSSDILD